MRSFLPIFFLLAGNSFAQDQPPAGNGQNGYKAFLKYQCYTCHGTVGQGADRGAGPKLAPNPFPWAGFEFQVRTPRQDMPAYRQQHLSDQDLADIYAYVRSIKAPPPISAIPLLKTD